MNKDEITDLELLCFCSEILGLLASSTHTYLLEEAKALNRKVYYFHYYRLWISAQSTLAQKANDSTTLKLMTEDRTSSSPSPATTSENTSSMANVNGSLKI